MPNSHVFFHVEEEQEEGCLVSMMADSVCPRRIEIIWVSDTQASDSLCKMETHDMPVHARLEK
jgi:hypothetical protein